MIVVAAQYSASPEGAVYATHPKMSGIQTCIIWFICCCWASRICERDVEMRCCSHIEATTMTTSGRFCAAPRLIPKK